MDRLAKGSAGVGLSVFLWLSNLLRDQSRVSLFYADIESSMKLQFLGANRQVTGSRYFLDTGRSQVLIDCGLFQEREFKHRNWDESPIDVTQLDAVLLTHAHIDHCGLLPRQYTHGCQAPIFATKPTVDLVDIMLRDSARIQEEDAEYKRKRHKKEGRKSKYPYDPLYTEEDARTTISHLRGVDYYNAVEVAEGVQVTFHDAGHILGSSSLEVTCQEGGSRTKIVFSGDIGQWDKPIIRDPAVMVEADFVVMESTYGDRQHREAGDIDTQLANEITATVARGGKLIIPTFAVERAQELTFHLGQLIRDGSVPEIPIYLDSPMAADVTDVFRGHRNVFDAETWNMISSGDPPLVFPGLIMSRTAKESKAINQVKGPAVIMSTSGMCTAGRIKHHLRNHLHDPRSTVLFVGYQSHGTLGRQILDGRDEVRIHGRMVKVKARIAQIYGFSGHADVDGLMRWASHFKHPPRRAFITHGEEDSAMALAKRLQEHDWVAEVPEYQQSFQLP